MTRQPKALARSQAAAVAPCGDRYIDDPKRPDIDPSARRGLDSGASVWTPKERGAYANDSRDDGALAASVGHLEIVQAAKDPSRWLPTTECYRCTYVTACVADKTRWT